MVCKRCRTRGDFFSRNSLTQLGHWVCVAPRTQLLASTSISQIFPWSQQLNRCPILGDWQLAEAGKICPVILEILGLKSSVSTKRPAS
jgi:hypothetical protein